MNTEKFASVISAVLGKKSRPEWVNKGRTHPYLDSEIKLLEICEGVGFYRYDKSISVKVSDQGIDIDELRKADLIVPVGYTVNPLVADYPIRLYKPTGKLTFIPKEVCKVIFGVEVDYSYLQTIMRVRKA